MTDDNKVLIEELERRLLQCREADSGEFDAEEVDAICTMLLKLSPEYKPRRTKEEAYQNILEQARLEEESSGEDKPEKSAREIVPESGKRKIFAGRRGLRAAAVFLVVVGVLASLNMVSYARENKSLFTMILERVGWLDIEKEAGQEGEALATEWVAKEFYDSWAELDREIKKKLIVPAYIPAGYELYGIKSWDLNDRKSLQADYYNQSGGHILFEITLWEKNADQYRENAADESIYQFIPEYSDENTLYYAYEDEYICLAFLENRFYRITGNIALEDMIKIREGI